MSLTRSSLFFLSLLLLLTGCPSGEPKTADSATSEATGEQAVIVFEEVSIKPAPEYYSKLDSIEDLLNPKARSGYGKNFVDSTLANTRILRTSDSKNLLKSQINNGLLGAMFESYSNHIPLVLRPDDVWLAVTAAFGLYVKNHSEEMRSYFVQHEGKQKLSVNLDDTIPEDSDKFWTEFATKLADKIKESAKPELESWIVPGFSTTTENDKLVGRITLMSAVSSYFSYEGVLGCGLSKLTLKGKLSDWQDLRDRAAKFSNYGKEMAAWAELMVPVLDQFIAAYKGEADDDFWQRMVTYKRLGSSGEKAFRGWFLVFAPFDEHGNYILNSPEFVAKTGIYSTVEDQRIQNATVSVNVDLVDLKTGAKRELIFWGGVPSAAYVAKDHFIRPSVDWAILEKDASKAESKEEFLRRLLETDFNIDWELKLRLKLALESEIEALFAQFPSFYREQFTAQEVRAQLIAHDEEWKSEELARWTWDWNEWLTKSAALLSREKVIESIVRNTCEYPNGNEYYRYNTKVDMYRDDQTPDGYDNLWPSAKDYVTREEFSAVMAVYQEELFQTYSKYSDEAKHELLQEFTKKYVDYDRLAPESKALKFPAYKEVPSALQRIFPEAEYMAAVDAEIKEQKRYIKESNETVEAQKKAEKERREKLEQEQGKGGEIWNPNGSEND